MFLDKANYQPSFFHHDNVVDWAIQHIERTDFQDLECYEMKCKCDSFKMGYTGITSGVYTLTPTNQKWESWMTDVTTNGFSVYCCYDCDVWFLNEN